LDTIYIMSINFVESRCQLPTT